MPLILRAFLMLIFFHFYLVLGDFSALYRRIRRYPVARRPHAEHTVERICHAVDLACIWYPKEVLCLQRSAVTVCLLRRYGIPALMVVGASWMPFRAHAWVEANGRVVNDKTYVSSMYAILDRC
jgi:Transglutaminase-like superfamily